VQLHGAGTHRDPEKGIGQTDLTPEIQGHLPVIPDTVIPVKQKPGGKFNGSNEKSTCEKLYGGGKPPLLQISQ